MVPVKTKRAFWERCFPYASQFARFVMDLLTLYVSNIFFRAVLLMSYPYFLTYRSIHTYNLYLGIQYFFHIQANFWGVLSPVCHCYDNRMESAISDLYQTFKNVCKEIHDRIKHFSNYKSSLSLSYRCKGRLEGIQPQMHYKSNFYHSVWIFISIKNRLITHWKGFKVQNLSKTSLDSKRFIGRYVQ